MISCTILLFFFPPILFTVGNFVLRNKTDAPFRRNAAVNLRNFIINIADNKSSKPMARFSF